METPNGLIQNTDFTATREFAVRAGHKQAIRSARESHAPGPSENHERVKSMPAPMPASLSTSMPASSSMPAAAAPRTSTAVVAAVPSTVPAAAMPAMPVISAVPAMTAVPVSAAIATGAAPAAVNADAAVNRCIRGSISVAVAGIIRLCVAVVVGRCDDASGQTGRYRQQCHRCNEPAHDFLLRVRVRNGVRTGVQRHLCPRITGGARPRAPTGHPSHSKATAQGLARRSSALPVLSSVTVG